MAARSAPANPLLRAAIDRALERLRPPRRVLGAANREQGRAESDQGLLLESLAAMRPSGRFVLFTVRRVAAVPWLLHGAPSARIAVVSEHDEVGSHLAAAWGEAGAAIEWWRESAAAVCDRIEPGLTLAVIDRPAAEARRLVDLLLPKLAVGGTLVILDVLADQVTGHDLPMAETAALERLRPYLLIHPQLAAAIVPLGSGLVVAIKRRETIREMGGPY